MSAVLRVDCITRLNALPHGRVCASKLCSGQSDVLILGAVEQDGVVLLSPTQAVADGSRVA